MYTNYVKCRAHRAFLAQIRGGSAPLEIELGRYRGIEKNKRMCKLCDEEVEDEIHFCMKCVMLDKERKKLFKYMEKVITDFRHMNIENQFIGVISEANFHPTISKCLYNMFIQRNKLLNV